MSALRPGASPLAAALADDLRRRAFQLNGRPARRRERMGAEIELIPVLAGTRAVCPIRRDGAGPSTLGFLQRYGRRRGWAAEDSPKGVPLFRLPDRGTLSFEPGGQLEYSSPACANAAELLGCLAGLVTPLCAAAREAGIELLSVGIDPCNPVEAAPLQLASDRYLRMAAYFQTLGPAGARMMRQTAAFHLNLDFDDEPVLRWRVLNALAPYLLAIFANSPLYAGRVTGHQSYRAASWRALDPARTGVFHAADDPAAEFLAFGLEAPAMLLDPDGAGYRPFAELLERGAAGWADWQAHLTTLFPEIQPRGYLEVRSADAIDPQWYAAPIVLLGGIVYHGPSLRTAADLLGSPDPVLLARAGVEGLHNPAMAGLARQLFELALEGAAARSDYFGGPALETARAYYQRFTRRGRAPADEALESIMHPARRG